MVVARKTVQTGAVAVVQTSTVRLSLNVLLMSHVIFVIPFRDLRSTMSEMSKIDSPLKTW